MMPENSAQTSIHLNILFLAFLDICLLRSGPQRLPASSFLLGLTLLAYFLTGLLVLGLDFSLGMSAWLSFLDIFVLLSVLSFALRRAGHSERFHQVAIAAIGCSTL